MRTALAIVVLWWTSTAARAEEPKSDLSKYRTGPGGANQAAGPGGQHPGLAGEVPGGSPRVGDRAKVGPAQRTGHPTEGR